jgi:hypothetical protein
MPGDYLFLKSTHEIVGFGKACRRVAHMAKHQPRALGMALV